MENILECRGLIKFFPNCLALNNVDLTVPKGRIVGLLGPNGSGKSTLIKLANGLLTPTQGTILVDGKAPGIETKKIVSYLPERTYLTEWMTVQDMLDSVSYTHLFAIERKLYIRTVVDHEAGALFHSRLLRKRSNIPINGEVFKGCWQRTGLSVTVHCIDTNLEIAIHSDFAAHRHIDRVGDRRPILVIIAVIGGERSSFLHNLQIDACLWIGVRGCMFRELARCV